VSIVSRFLGKKERAFERGMVANPDIESSLSLQVLFEEVFVLCSNELEEKFKEYQPKLSRVQVEFHSKLEKEQSLLGMFGWEEHVIQMIGFAGPMPADSVELCVAPSHYDQNLKGAARNHQSHILLYYKGYNPDPIVQYAAMALVAGFMSNYGAVVVANESARTSFPTQSLLVEKTDGDAIEVLASLPLLALYCGFIKYEVEGLNGVWMRTYGAPMLGLPDMASLAQGHSQGQATFDIFSNVFNYLMNSGAQFAAGNTMQVGEDLFMRLRLPTAEEYYLESSGEIFVADFIPASEVNAV